MDSSAELGIGTGSAATSGLDAGNGLPATMRAVLRSEYGTTEVLELGEIEIPGPADDQVLVRVHAAGFEPGVWHLMTGLPGLVRFMGFGLRRPKARVLGSDFAGRVVAVGAAVSGFRPGDEVYGVAAGSFAEYAVADADRIAYKPVNLSFEQAAVVPISAITALQALRDKGRTEAGQKVLVIGAGGGVGTFAVQLAKALGAEVTAVCSTAKTELVRSIGADRVIDYTQEDFAPSGDRYDLILDTGGNRPLGHLRRALTPRGTLIIVGGEGGGRWLGATVRMLRAMILSPFVGQTLRPMVASERAADLVFLKEMIEGGKVRPVIDRSFDLSDVPEAIRFWERGQVRGKVVITV
jgi:NADPH:quinone reductase-like Zn-dependent oxidoreductase